MPAVVAQRIDSHDERRRRTIDERAMVRFPKLYAWVGKLILPLSPRSRLRQGLMRRQVLSGWAASSRDDFELMQIRYAEDVVFEWNPELVTLGLPPRIEGRENWLKSALEFRATWIEWRYRLDFILDLGELVITLGRAWYRGGASGVDLEIEYAQVIELRGATVSRERDFTNWPAALGATGLDGEILERLDRLAPGAVVEL